MTDSTRVLERESYARRQRRTAEIRRPPRPPHETMGGTCALCGLSPLPGRRRSWCSDECVLLWNIATSGQIAAHHLTSLHGNACWDCGRTEQPGHLDPEDQRGYIFPHGAERWTLADLDERRPWRGPWCDWPPPPEGPPPPEPVRLHVDHVRPLWLLTPEEAKDLRFWLPYNLQLLCSGCHGIKTKAEAKLRAQIRREDPDRLR